MRVGALRKAAVFAWVILATWSVLVGESRAQDAGEAGVITAIRVEGNQRIEDSTVVSYMKTVVSKSSQQGGCVNSPWRTGNGTK